MSAIAVAFATDVETGSDLFCFWALDDKADLDRVVKVIAAIENGRPLGRSLEKIG